MSRVYLAVPIIAGRDLVLARGVAEVSVGLGHEVVSTWVLKEDVGLSLPPQRVFERDVNGVEECDGMVAEVSTPSHGVGMEIMLAHMLGKPVVGLHRPETRLSRMLRGMPGIVLLEYRSGGMIERLLKVLDEGRSPVPVG